MPIFKIYRSLLQHTWSIDPELLTQHAGQFEEPGKIDLADYMEKNFMFTMPLEKVWLSHRQKPDHALKGISKRPLTALRKKCSPGSAGAGTLPVCRKRKSPLTFVMKWVLKTRRISSHLKKHLATHPQSYWPHRHNATSVFSPAPGWHSCISDELSSSSLFRQLCAGHNFQLNATRRAPL